jgi:iron complex transport system ATP-binding protein
VSVRDVLRLEGIEVSLAGRPILAGADLSLGEGEVLGLVGRNGAGKTTLLRVASRVLRPARGRVWIGDAPAESLEGRDFARRVAVVPQDTGIPFAFSVAEVVLMGRAPHLGLLGFEGARDHAVAVEALERLGIAQLAERSVLEISGGERQLVMLARALAQESPILLLDEPTAHLDLPHRLEVLELARVLAGSGRSVLVVSHDLPLLARFCDRLALLAGGRLEVGPCESMLEPDRLREAFGLDAELLRTGAGEPIVVPHLPSRGPGPDR